MSEAPTLHEPVDPKGRPARCAHRFPDPNVWLAALCDVDDRWADGDEVLNVAAVHAAKTLRSYMNKTGYCYPSVESLARRTRVKERAVQRAISTLEHAGWLMTDRTGGRATPSKYWTAVPGGLPDLVDRLADYLNTRADRGRSLPMLAEALAPPAQEKGGDDDALCMGHRPERLCELGAVDVRTDAPAEPAHRTLARGRTDTEPQWEAKGVVCDRKGVDRDGGSTSEDPSPLPVPSPSRRPANTGYSVGEGSRRRPARLRAAAGTMAADALGQDFPRFREFLERLSDQLNRADEVQASEGTRLYQAVTKLDHKAQFALTVCRLIDDGWERLLWHTLTEVPPLGTTAYGGCRNPAAVAARRVFDLEQRLEERPATGHTELVADAPKRLGSGWH